MAIRVAVAAGNDFQWSSMRVVVNGESREIATNTSVSGLVKDLGYGERRIAVERNGEILPRSQHADTLVEDGDVIEIVQAIGGG